MERAQSLDVFGIGRSHERGAQHADANACSGKLSGERLDGGLIIADLRRGGSVTQENERGCPHQAALLLSSPNT
jgi:hypothetical protein